MVKRKFEKMPRKDPRPPPPQGTPPTASASLDQYSLVLAKNLLEVTTKLSKNNEPTSADAGPAKPGKNSSRSHPFTPEPHKFYTSPAGCQRPFRFTFEILSRRPQSPLKPTLRCPSGSLRSAFPAIRANHGKGRFKGTGARGLTRKRPRQGLR